MANPTNALVDWFNEDWKKRIPITINAGQVPSTQNDFPMLINSTFPDLIGKSINEIRFAGKDDTVPLPLEVQDFDSITGKLIAWTRKPTLSDDEMTYLYCDNPNPPDAQNLHDVWDEHYKAVYHGQNGGMDSTRNEQHLTDFGTTSVDAQIGKGRNFNGTKDQYMMRYPFTGFPSTAITFGFWIKSNGSGDGIMSYAVPSDYNHLAIVNQEDLRFVLLGSSAAVDDSINDGEPHHIAITWGSSDGESIIYHDGVPKVFGEFAVGREFIDGRALVLGQEQDDLAGGFDSAQSLRGVLNHVPLSDVVREPDYITTSYRNQHRPNEFYSIGNVETL